ncbi:GNAT family N-acetyltransferase [Nocardioides xinjiangensis]|uniref:GNAT family N-acetyltransferase n=1 Tax=Nocardioides xinjiangensis TaxID=2817376 RepID=UPI001FF01714|nr:GNAT family N-acetyltransferase [Nocardioides sp. SYSU D00514]
MLRQKPVPQRRIPGADSDAQDVPVVVEVQQPAAAVGLAKVFPQDRFPFPCEAVARRWADDIATLGIDCFVVEQDGAVVGFAAVRADELMHFGIALERWGTGAAQDAHDAVLDRMSGQGVTRVATSLHRQRTLRRFYERLGWTPTGERSHSTFPPYAELLRYEQGLTSSTA